MTSSLHLEIPAPFDRRRNGRCRAYWMAHERCPNKRIPHEYAMENMHRYLERAAALDEREGPLPACRGDLTRGGKPRVRQRVRGVRYA